MIRKVDVPPDVHAAIPQTLDPVCAPAGVEPGFERREQRNGVQGGRHET